MYLEFPEEIDEDDSEEYIYSVHSECLLCKSKS